MQLSTMQDYPLTLRPILQHGRTVHANSKVITFTGDGYVESTFAEVADRADQLAAALTRLGVNEGDRVGTFMWNNQTHLEAYLAVPCMGAVLHTLNIRLFPEQLSFVINHADDQVIIVDASIIPLLAKVRDQLTTVKHIIVKGSGDTSALGETLDYDTFLAAEKPGFDYPDLDENAAQPFQTVRAAFEEGEPAFAGSMIRRETHIQIAVRDPRCILGVFRPMMVA